ncbi:hypothetical protein [Streptomyces arenae]|uniref:hypothetical protein n=1 Tax=Streptomyces arenae TaxID=29301 RepID=UPI00265AEB9D|nr:hypothetical protein [Streptomyces arenae]MCG7208070.1 hypothetical protein [Streptomyces arenae]
MTSKSFTAWWKTHADQGNAVGDLDWEVPRDPDRPSRKGLPGQRTYLDERGAVPAAMETLERAGLNTVSTRPLKTNDSGLTSHG